MTCLSEEIIICSEDVQTGRSWIQSIKEAIDTHIETRKTIRKDSSKRQPMRKKQLKKFEKFEAELMSPSDKKNVSYTSIYCSTLMITKISLQNFDKIFYGQNMSMTDIDEVGKGNKFGCFQTASNRILKRKHSESNENEQKIPKKSFLSSIGEKLGFQRPSNTAPKSILTQNNVNQGEMNYSYQHDGFSAFNVTNDEVEQEHEIPKKRVKFDEDNLIVSSITYQRQQSQVQRMMFHPKTEEKSLMSKLIDYTANLF